MRVIPLLLLSALAVSAEPVKVGKYAAKIVPEQVSPLNLPTRGTVTDLVDTSRRLEAGTVIAVLNKEKTAEDREDMELALERETLTKTDELRKLQQQRKRVAFYLQLSDEERAYAAADDKDGEITKDTLKDIDKRIGLLKREMETSRRRRINEFESKHNELTLTMPYTGRLQYSFTPPEDSSKPFKYGGNHYQSFATVCDDSAFYITVAISNSILTQLPEENFSVVINLPKKKDLHGTYSHRKVENNNNGDMLVYFFRLPEEDHDIAYSMLGSNSTAVLYYEAGEGAMSVSKAELVADPRAAECEDWQQLISTVHPGYSIEIVAERDIIIRKD